jgi:hypothetical protein
MTIRTTLYLGKDLSYYPHIYDRGAYVEVTTGSAKSAMWIDSSDADEIERLAYALTDLARQLRETQAQAAA